jgi:uncharacterized protein YegL
MRRVFLILALLAAPALADSKEAVAAFKRNFKPGMMYATRAGALEKLLETPDLKVLEAFEWAREFTTKEVLKRILERDDHLKVLRRLETQMSEIQAAAIARAKKEGRPPPRNPPVPMALGQAFTAAREKRDRLQQQIETEYELRDLAAATMGKWLAKLPGEIRGKAFEKIERGGLRDRDRAVRAFTARALGHAPVHEATRLLLLRLQVETDRRVLPALIDAVGRQAGELAIEHLVSKLTDERWQIRAAAIAALGRTKSKSAVEPLIARLRIETGRLRGDIAAALKEICGVDLGVNPDRWQKWWDANRGKDGFGADDGSGKGGEAAPAPVGTPSFYGIRVLSKRILFVIDVSGSMADPADSKRKDRSKIDVAKYELTNALLSLPEDAHFNIVFYASEVSVWRKGMVKATGKDKRSAVKSIEKVKAEGATNIFDALKRAFNIVGLGAKDKNYNTGADTIFFLSDGQPTRGDVLDTNQIAMEVKRWNGLRRVKIHSVGVGKQHDSTFMKRLADESGGEYVRR